MEQVIASKKCTKCDIEQTLDLFHKNPSCKDGRASWCKKCQHQQLKDSRKFPAKRAIHAVYSRKSSLKSRYGITLDEYEKKLQLQKWSCAICGSKKPENEKRQKNLAVDHNHATGFVRGILCQKCNRGIGLFNDDISRLQSAVQYLINAQQNEKNSKTS